MKVGLRYAVAVMATAVVLSACGADVGIGAGVGGGNSYVGVGGSFNLDGSGSSITPYGKIGAGVEVTR